MPRRDTGPEPTAKDEGLAQIEGLHDAVDAATAPLRARHAARLRCRRGCSACCVDEIRVFAVEAERIRACAADVLREAPHPPGACAFLDAEGACRIYAHRPYVCRTQGLPLRWIDWGGEDGAVERRDICALNEPGEPIEELPAAVCWELGPVEARLASLQAERQGRDAAGRRPDARALARVRLRDLFGSPDG